jgi:integrase
LSGKKEATSEATRPLSQGLPMAFRLFKNRRKGTWYFVRRVPLQYQHLDPRGMIRRTTGVRIGADPHGVAARRVAESFDAAEESRWAGLAGDATAKTMAEYQAACEAAKKLGVSAPLPQQATRTIEELLDRIEQLERGKVAEDKAGVAALLDAAPIPDLTFRQCAEQYITSHTAGWSNAKHAAQWPTTLEQYVYPAIGALPVAQLSGRAGTQKIKALLDPIWYTKTTTASRVRGRIEKVLDWAKAQGFRDGETPARWVGHLDSIYPTKEKVAPVKHHAAMPFRDVPAFMDKLREQEGIAARALEFTILTAGRTSEILEAKRSEIDRAARMWIVPKERMKTRRREHRVPLCDSALKIIDGLPQQGEYLFPGHKAGRPLDHKTLLRVLETTGVSDDATAHGFRSTFDDWASEVGDYPNEMIKLAIAHAIGDKAEAAYRRGSMLQKRHALMADWEAYCNGKLIGARR